MTGPDTEEHDTLGYDPQAPDPAHEDTALETDDPRDTEPARGEERDLTPLPNEIPDATEVN